MSVPCIGIVADDLTGGAAIAGEIARPARPVAVLRLGDALPIAAQTLVLETGSRYMPTAEAEARVAQAVRLLRQAGFTLLMKKIDSTLKGNVAAELAAFARATAQRLVIVAACPTMHISVREGRQWRATEQGIDVVSLVGDALGWTPEILPLSVVHGGERQVSRWLHHHSAQVIVADAESQQDIQHIVNGARGEGIGCFAGVYGLGRALAALSDVVEPPRPQPVRQLMVMSGSASPATIAQIDDLLTHDVDVVTINVAALCSEQHAQEMQRLHEAIAISAAPILVLHTDAKNSAATVRELCRMRGWNDRELAQALAAPFAEAALQRPAAGLFIIGGETTGALFERLNWQTMQVYGEFSATVPVSQLPATDHPVVLTKPGAFGAVTILHDVAQWLLKR